MALLVCLAETPGRVWTRDELFERLWPDRFVTENSLTNAVSELRRVLGDARGAVETVPKVGYRLAESPRPVDLREIGSVPEPGRGAAPRPGRSRDRWAHVAVGTAALLLGAWALVSLPGPALEGPEREAVPPGVPADYVASLPLGRRGAPNEIGVSLLETAVAEEPGYVPAWSQLSERMYFRAWDAEQPTRWRGESELLARTALDLKPDDPAAALRLVVLGAERGETRTALELARGLVARHPQSAEARFSLSYAYRYAGLLEPAAAECRAALELGRGAPGLRSCAVVAYRLRRFGEARDFLQLDEGTQWAAHQEAMVRLFEDGTAAAAAAFQRLPEHSLYAGLLESCRAPDLDRLGELERRVSGAIDPEAQWEAAALLAACGQPERASRLLEAAALGGYCAPEAFDGRPPFGELTALPAGRRAARRAAECRSRFLGRGA